MSAAQCRNSRAVVQQANSVIALHFAVQSNELCWAVYSTQAFAAMISSDYTSSKCRDLTLRIFLMICSERTVRVWGVEWPLCNMYWSVLSEPTSMQLVIQVYYVPYCTVIESRSVSIEYTVTQRRRYLADHCSVHSRVMHAARRYAANGQRKPLAILHHKHSL